jgi:hypothetical protein
MSRPGGPYRDEPGRQQYQPQQYPPQQYQDQRHPDQRYQQQQPQYPQQGYRPQSGQRPAPQRPAAPPPPPERDGRSFPLPGLGLLLSLIGLVVQILSFTVLPWVYSSASKDSAALPAIWDAAKNFDAQGFSGAYVVLFSYPLAVLGILLSLVAVIESVAMKVVWAALTIIGIGVLVLKFGLGPIGEKITGGELDFSRQEITIAVIALAALAVVIFMLKMAMSMFRRVAGLVLLVIGGVHIAAVSDLSDGFGFADLQVGAYGPAVGYVLAAAAAFVGPRKLA